VKLVPSLTLRVLGCEEAEVLGSAAVVVQVLVMVMIVLPQERLRQGDCVVEAEENERAAGEIPAQVAVVGAAVYCKRVVVVVVAAEISEPRDTFEKQLEY
jgi:hypothetical protein